MNAEKLAYWESKIRIPVIRFLPPRAIVRLYSRGRLAFLKQLYSSIPERHSPPAKYQRVCWGLTFRFPLFNAAGMFKNGEGYELTAAHGAGAFLLGMTTANPRIGNEKDGIYLPFAPYPLSKSASNWLGLPNDGDEAVAMRVRGIQRVPGCPVGVSVMGSPDLQGEEKLRMLVRGMKLYEEAGVDFLEVNESCPNTAHGSPQQDALSSRLEYLSRNFLLLRQRNRLLPVIVKFSNDTQLEQVPELLEMLLRFGFDGVNFGNTSTAYAKHRESIAGAEKPLYDYYTSTFGGGVSGAPLRSCSLELIQTAREALKNLNPDREFHLIRAGGIEGPQDLWESLQEGASLVQWFTGYFEAFSKNGGALYEKLWNECRVNQIS